MKEGQLVEPLASVSKLTEKCAVFGVYGSSKEAARTAYYGLWALQHRGQESSGIATSDGHRIHSYAASGLVANVYREENLDQLPGHIAIGHNRYATSGGNDNCFNQPFVTKNGKLAYAHNGNLPDCSKLIAFLNKHSLDTASLNDSQMMVAVIDHYMAKGLAIEKAIEKAYPLFTGVFSSVAMDSKKLVAFRDECGIRPLAIGTLGDGYAVASETCAFDTIGATYLRDVEPGELVIIDEHGLTSYQIAKPRPRLDIFEFVYFARPDSMLLGQRVQKVRENFGLALAKEYQIEADVVVPVPDSSIPAALGYAQGSGIPFDMGLIKNRYINRTFIQPTAELRRRDVAMKLNPVYESLAGKRVVLVDDSIVRGTTMRQVVKMLKSAGAKEIHVLVSCPPVKYPDFYGINTPDPSDLISANKSVEETREYLSADSLKFLSMEGMVAATSLPASSLSMSCFDGIYPISIGKRAKDVTYPKAAEDDYSATKNSQKLPLETAEYTQVSLPA